MRNLIVLSRPGCHLCEQAIEQIEPMCRSSGVALRVVDVDADTATRERYGPRIPVILGSGQELSAWPLDLGRIAGWLNAAP
jgi:Glutaredoxin-like domain (DUF836)